MSDDWRVRLVNQARSAGDTSADLNALRDRLRGRVGKGITVTKPKAGVIFLYAATGAAAVSAQDTARKVLAELGTAVDMRVERRDPRQQAWVVSAGGATVLPPGQPDSGRDRRLLIAGIAIGSIIDSTGTRGTGVNCLPDRADARGCLRAPWRPSARLMASDAATARTGRQRPGARLGCGGSHGVFPPADG